MAQARVKGCVVGYDLKGGELVWSVKVKDSSSIHDGQKFAVHSLSNGFMISRPSVEVNFMVEPIQVGQEKILRATEVAFGAVLPAEREAENGQKNEVTLNIIICTFKGKFHVFFTNMESEEEVLTSNEFEWNEENKFIAFVKIPSTAGSDNFSVLPEEDFEAGLLAISALSYVPPTRDAMGHVFCCLLEAANKYKG
jgi:hypothetical protein